MTRQTKSGQGAPPKYRNKKPSEVSSNPKVDDDGPVTSGPAGTGKRLPVWAKWIVGVNVGMIHLVVVLVGVEGVPFTLSDPVLVAYVVACLSSPIGLASQAVRDMLAGLFGVKS